MHPSQRTTTIPVYPIHPHYLDGQNTYQPVESKPQQDSQVVYVPNHVTYSNNGQKITRRQIVNYSNNSSTTKMKSTNRK